MTRVVSKKRNVRRPFWENVQKKQHATRATEQMYWQMRSSVLGPSSAPTSTVNTKYEIGIMAKRNRDGRLNTVTVSEETDFNKPETAVAQWIKHIFT